MYYVSSVHTHNIEYTICNIQYMYIQNCIVDCSFMFISGCHKNKTALIKDIKLINYSLLLSTKYI